MINKYETSYIPSNKQWILMNDSLLKIWKKIFLTIKSEYIQSLKSQAYLLQARLVLRRQDNFKKTTFSWELQMSQSGQVNTDLFSASKVKDKCCLFCVAVTNQMTKLGPYNAMQWYLFWRISHSFFILLRFLSLSIW